MHAFHSVPEGGWRGLSPLSGALNRDVSANPIPARLARPRGSAAGGFLEPLFLLAFRNSQYKQGFRQPELATFSGIPAFHSHPGGNPGANLESISRRCYLREEALEWELIKETIVLPLSCLWDGVPQGGRRRGVNRKSQFHEQTGELTSKVNFQYLSRNQWLQLPNPTARRRIKGGQELLDHFQRPRILFVLFRV